MPLHDNKLLRQLVVPLLAKLGDFDISIRHHYTNDNLRLNVFRHKGYWYHGRKRERDCMAAFARLINKGDVVIDVGGHIGYVSLYFSQLVGNAGRVVVFEPGINNLPYIERNVSSVSNISLINKALSDQRGVCPFYIEDVAGQNNSLIKDFWVFEANVRKAFVKRAYKEVSVDTMTLDDFVSEARTIPQLVKIDVEGSEFNVLRGAARTVRQHKPILMLEVNVRHADVYRWLLRNGYDVCDTNLRAIDKRQEVGMPNIFCLHREAHAEILEAASVANYVDRG